MIKIYIRLTLADGKTMIDFLLAFDKSKKKSEKGLYKLKFSVPDE
jgi:hypothetical protein